MKIGEHLGYRAKLVEISGYIFPTIKSPLGKVLFVSNERIQKFHNGTVNGTFFHEDLLKNDYRNRCWWIPEESAQKEKVIL